MESKFEYRQTDSSRWNVDSDVGRKTYLPPPKKTINRPVALVGVQTDVRAAELMTSALPDAKPNPQKDYGDYEGLPIYQDSGTRSKDRVNGYSDSKEEKQQIADADAKPTSPYGELPALALNSYTPGKSNYSAMPAHPRISQAPQNPGSGDNRRIKTSPEVSASSYLDVLEKPWSQESRRPQTEPADLGSTWQKPPSPEILRGLENASANPWRTVEKPLPVMTRNAFTPEASTVRGNQATGQAEFNKYKILDQHALEKRIPTTVPQPTPPNAQVGENGIVGGYKLSNDRNIGKGIEYDFMVPREKGGEAAFRMTARFKDGRNGQKIATFDAREIKAASPKDVPPGFAYNLWSMDRVIDRMRNNGISHIRFKNPSEQMSRSVCNVVSPGQYWHSKHGICFPIDKLGAVAEWAIANPDGQRRSV